MSNKEKLELVIKESPKIKAAVAYGSRSGDLDYMLWIEPKQRINPLAIWPEGICGGRNLSKLCVVGEDLFDLAVSEFPMRDDTFVKWSDMLRNSIPEPEWIKDEVGIGKLVSDHIAAKPRKQMTVEQILVEARAFYINLRFLESKCQDGTIFARYMIAHTLEPILLKLCREVDFRRGGRGFGRGKHVEKVFTSAEVEMLTVDYALDTKRNIASMYKLRTQIVYWLKLLDVPIPDYLCKSW